MIALVLISSVFSSFVFAIGGGGGCPSTADYYVTGTVNSDSTYKIYKSNIPGLPDGYYIDNDDPFCESCGDADVKGSGSNRYIEYDPEECCGTITFYFKVKTQETYTECHTERKCDKRWVCTRWHHGHCTDGYWDYYNCHDEEVCEEKTRTVYKTVKVTLDVIQSYDYSITATIASGDIYKLYMDDDRLPEGFDEDDFEGLLCSSGICGELKYKNVKGGTDYIQYIPYVEECSDCHWECLEKKGCGGCGCDCDWVCSGCENRDCCGDNTFYFKIKEKERYEDCDWERVCDKRWECNRWGHDCHWEYYNCHNEWVCHEKTRTVYKTVKVSITVDCTPPCETAPIANDDSYRTNENTCATFNVIENDIDPDDLGSPDLTIVDVTVPEYGTAEISGNKIYYCPLGNYCGEDTFYYQIETENGCAPSNYAKVTVTIPCKTPLPESILYPGVDIERLTIPGGPVVLDESINSLIESGIDVISDGKVVAALEVVPGTQSLVVQVENRGSLTQADVSVRFEGLPEGVLYTFEPDLQKVYAHNLGTYIVTLTASPNVLSGTYPVKVTAYSRNGVLDQIEIKVVIT